MKKVMLGMLWMACLRSNLQAVEPWDYSDRNQALLAVRQQVVRVMAKSLLDANVQVVTAEYRVDGVNRVVAASSNPDRCLGMVVEKLVLQLELRPFFVKECLWSNQFIAPVIYVSDWRPGTLRGHPPLDQSKGETARQTYSPRTPYDDSMWLLFIEAARFELTPALAETVRENPVTCSPENVVLFMAQNLQKLGTEGVLKAVSLDEFLKKETWFNLSDKWGRSRFELNMPGMRLPPLSGWHKAYVEKQEQEASSRETERNEERAEQGILRSEFLDDLRLILYHVRGKSSADASVKIGIREADMKTDIGRSLLRELRDAIATRVGLTLPQDASQSGAGEKGAQPQFK